MNTFTLTTAAALMASTSAIALFEYRSFTI